MTILISQNQLALELLIDQIGANFPRVYTCHESDKSIQRAIDLGMKPDVIGKKEFEAMKDNYEIYQFSNYFAYSIEDIEEFAASGHLVLFGTGDLSDSLRLCGMETKYIKIPGTWDDAQVEERVEEVLDSLEFRD